MKKSTWILAVGISALIILSGSFRIYQIKENSKQNQKKAAECVDGGGTVMLYEGSIFSLSSVSCEQ
ncbi:hypothetical protein [Rossellomorea marisflavi]|uniref:hypothetical protein n=1 Tax=Rossellomorea marisflavi TaxID=189381 RepID=UPI003513DAC6